MSNDAHFRLRIPLDLKAWVEGKARENNRSINSEVLACIQESMSMESKREKLEEIDELWEWHKKKTEIIEENARKSEALLNKLRESLEEVHSLKGNID